MADDPCFQPEGTVKLPTICLNDLEYSSEPHEPPIGFGNGSLYMSWNMEITELGYQSADSRPYKYVLVDSSANRGAIAVVKVLTEQNGGRVSSKRYLLPKETKARVLIWLQQLTSASPPYPADYEDRASDAQVLVKGDNLLIETDRQLHASHATYKNSRRFGYEHPGYSRHFRIAAWAIINETGGLVMENNDPFGRSFTDSGEDAYQIYISFHD